MTDDKTWYIMKDIPSLTVCHECFNDAVSPELDRDGAVESNFSRRPQRLARAAGQLYSPRMRAIFQMACRTDDMGFLQAYVLERQRIEAEIHKRLQEYEVMEGNEVDAS